MWLSVIKMAKEGNLEAMNHLQAENKIRQEQSRPTVEQELQMIAEESENKRLVEAAKKRLREQS